MVEHPHKSVTDPQAMIVRYYKTKKIMYPNKCRGYCIFVIPSIALHVNDNICIDTLFIYCKCRVYTNA